LYGEASLLHRTSIEETGREIAEAVTVEGIPGSGHWIADENPDGLVQSVLHFDGKHI
jgi:hypothetical protein